MKFMVCIPEKWYARYLVEASCKNDAKKKLYDKLKNNNDDLEVHDLELSSSDEDFPELWLVEPITEETGERF